MDNLDICKEACNKYYLVEFNHNCKENFVTGLLLNYNSGNIVLLAEEGIYHIKNGDITFMRPLKR